MSGSLSRLKLQRVRPPVRRVLALDAGSRRVKLLLAQSDFGRFHVLRQEMLDLEAEGLVTPEEIKAHLQATLQSLGQPPVALVLPQHVSISQIIDLPLAPESEVDKLIADETIKLSGVSESRIVYDFVRLQTSAHNKQPFWVTFSQEGEIRERISALGLEQEELCEVTTTANALIAAYQRSPALSSRAVLVHLGAESTVVVVVVAGQGAFATSFQMGGDFFTRALARLRNCSEEKAERLKRETDLLNQPQASAEFCAVVDGWAAELKRQLSEWFQQNPAPASGAASFDLVACGGGFDQPGLFDYLRAKAAFPFQTWPSGNNSETSPAPAKGFEVAFGTALQALGYSRQPVSLLPDDYRIAWRKNLNRQRVEWASLALVALCVLVLAFGTWRKLSLINTQQTLLSTIRAGQEAVEANELLTGDLITEYENLRPIFAAQQNTIDTLRTLSLLQQARSNRSLWFVLLADQQSYFSQPPAALLATNRPARTNLLGAALEPPRLGIFVPRTNPAALTNLALARPGFIAELSVPGDAETARQTLSDLVNGLKQQRLFSKVDLLSDDLRRSLADSKVTIPERDYVLALDFAETDFLQPTRWKKPVSSRQNIKRTARPAFIVPETSGEPNQANP